ncbi:MAG TPA: SusC/RagA family TonB-linked outer membrane protein [Porphyromonadaceae bacterium]|nr:SusC/RagA family TonB-linked outer membrane protein [Porphyromonadaceae bacterium]HBK32706.1 SusC/RagA family TonB-linked outer membrane protein [Porphyromonadaceae bacterium]HBL33807.1 SusC/RagA family TonB-linked outer membrane protein [Porphyromonadaceae bacterium]HBX20028.1 SusC/RagA family TonB-linked outer membrane protein [Porphyromonadaceae bacterium]HBX44865.1 SusC/RagA family TonB-linked outer membrane protein [Porphyromonadaceae bacterium]
MRITIIFLFCSILFSHAAESYSQVTKVSLDLGSASIKEVCKEIEKKTDYIFVFSDNTESYINMHVNARINSQTIFEILNNILLNTGLSYKVLDKQVVIYKDKRLSKNRELAFSEEIVQQQKKAILGTVLDISGAPIIGVNVVEKNTTNGTVTDIDGKFSLYVADDAVIQFSFIGFFSKEVSTLNKTSFNIILEEDTESLDEVVVVGFGTQKKVSVVGAQSTVKAKSLQLPVANLTNALAGRISGIVSVQRTSEPGFDDAEIWIRGISTFSQGLSAPLILVDGTPRKMANVDPEDIESFTVLKDASATAVYGVRGANGVVIIKTKNGEPGRPKFNFRYYEGITQFTKLPEFADGITYMRMSNEALTNRGATPLYSEDRIQKTIEGSDPYLYPNVDWMDALFRDYGHQRRGNLNISGGADKATYYVGLSYFDESGLYKQDDLVDYNQQVGYKRYNLTSNLKIAASKTTNIDLGISGYLANANYPGSGQGTIFENAWIVTPVIHPIKYENGSIADQRSGGLTNPYGHLTQTGYANQWRNQLYSNLRVTQDLPFITQGLSATAMFSFDVYNYTSMRRTKVPDTYLATGRDENGEMQYEQTRVGERFLKFARSSQGERTIYLEGALNYNRSFDKHTTTAMLLFNKSDLLNSQAGDLITSLPYRYLGLSGRATYNYDNKYFGEFNFGYNGSENFDPSHQFGFFPSIGLAWVFSEEKFFENVQPYLPLAKLRFSHGKVGNSNISGRRFAYISTINSTTGYNFGKDRNNSFDGYNIGEYGVNVTWETSTKTNLGLDLQTKNNELIFQFDVFKEYREGIFLRRANIPSYAGILNAPYGNLGIIENKGFDGSFTYSKKINDFSFQVLGNLTFNRNKVIENDQPEPLYPWLDQRGKKVSQRFGLRALGLFESEDEIKNGPLHPGTVNPGDIKFQDVNGDGKIDDYDKVAIGYGTVPELVYGFGITLTYKNLSLSSLFQGVGNVDILMNGEGVMPFSNSMSRGNLLSNIEDRWTIDNPRQDAFYPRLSDGSPNSNYVTSTWWLKNGRYLRLKDLQLTYNLPKRMIKQLHVSNANIFFAGYNLLTWSPFKFWDVELGDGRGTRYPNTKMYSVGININF